LYHTVSKAVISKVSCVLGVIFILALSYVAGWSLRGISGPSPCYGRPGRDIYRKHSWGDVHWIAIVNGTFNTTDTPQHQSCFVNVVIEGRFVLLTLSYVFFFHIRTVHLDIIKVFLSTNSCTSEGS